MEEQSNSATNEKKVEVASGVNPAALSVQQLRNEAKKIGLKFPSTAKRVEIETLFIETVLSGLKVSELKNILKAHEQLQTGVKAELVERLKKFFSEKPKTPIEESEEVCKLTPKDMKTSELKSELSKRGIQNAGKKPELVPLLVEALTSNLTVDQLKVALKAHDVAFVGGNKEELLQRLKGHLDGSIKPTEGAIKQDEPIDVNNATKDSLSNLPGIGDVLADRIIAARPIKSLYHMKSSVTGIGNEKLKVIAPMLTGWLLDQSQKSQTYNFSENEANAQKRRENNEMIIASWNVRCLSRNKTDEKLHKIIDLITSFDLLAIQEVRDDEIMTRIIEKLGSDWDMVVSDFIGTDHHKERYAFVWRKSAVSLVSGPQLLNDISNNFVRPPFMAFFRSKLFDFVLVTIHVVWGPSVQGRREEIRKLGTLLTKIQEKAKDENDIILVGDFNMPPTDLSWEVDGWLPLIRPPSLTVVGDTSLYDNIWVSGEYTFNSEYKGSSGVIEFDKLLYEDSIQGRRQAISEVSDHRPVWGLFSTNVDDDIAETVNLNVSL
eukprot:TRINITY_DN613_c0_g6_i2.p1 TRINITY_DN613_c0_g6~~TRINITY_DN613_c0_g6_i2.p1  ORF type:complete len:548 (+),score=115.41 TRINITY_DN613_c0_g6_i2:311-1954(+)